MMHESPKKEIDSEVADGVGELTNIFYGKANVELAKHGHSIDLSTPTVTIDKNEHLPSHPYTPNVLIPFATKYGSFTIEIDLLPYH